MHPLPTVTALSRAMLYAFNYNLINLHILSHPIQNLVTQITIFGTIRKAEKYSGVLFIFEA